MPSKEAEAARLKAAEVMAALKKGDNADATMGDREKSGTRELVPFGTMKKKLFSRNKKDKTDSVIR